MKIVRKNFIKKTADFTLWGRRQKAKKKHWCGLCTFLGWISASNTIGSMWISKFAIGGSLDDKGTKNLGIWLSSYLARFQSKPWRPRRRSTLLYTTSRSKYTSIYGDDKSPGNLACSNISSRRDKLSMWVNRGWWSRIPTCHRKTC